MDMNSYNEMLRRFVAYRKRMGLTQEQMAQKLDISQEQCSNLENGITKITDRQLKVLLETGWNIDEIITGTKMAYKKTELEEIFDTFEDEEEKEFVMKLCAELVLKKAARCRLTDRDSMLKEYLVLLENMVESWQHFSMCLYIRKILQLSQVNMAEKLGIGIKKYRDMEREIKYPNAEMLLYFYEVSGYHPTLFMEVHDKRMLTINQIWNRFEKKERKEIIGFVDFMRNIL